MHVVFIIRQQRNLSIGHIMFKHVISDANNSFKIGTGNETDNSYRKSEQRIALFYVVFIGLYVA